MFKNITPQRLTLLMAAIVSFVNVGLVAIYFLKVDASVDWVFFVFLIIVSFCVSYFFLRFLIERYLYRRIKPIYKIIRKNKLDKRQKISISDFQSNFLGNIEDEVQEWAEEARNEIKSLKSLEEYRKSYVGNISHELKTPLFSIQGYIQTILSEEMDKETQANFLERAGVNVDRLITIVQDLDSITKMESGKTLLDIQAFNIRELAEEVIQDLEIQANAQSVEVVFKDGANNPYMVSGDRENIRQVLNNLINNSIKYGLKGGKTKISFYDLDKYILVEVSDNGIGIEEKHLKHLFDRFYRVDKSRSRSVGGSGLGLSIVKHIIEAHGQDLNVRSTVGKGTTFGFTLSKA